MDKTYQPENIEQHWYQVWEQSGYFEPNDHGTPYCIMLPPPNVTGTLHMGHGFQISLMDALIRYHRMRGFSTLWQVGTDHAGIATQMVVEKQLRNEGIQPKTIGRDAFVTRVWSWKDQSDGTIKQQLRRMGASVDWEKERFSLDPGLNEAVIEVFTSLYNEGLIYRGQRLVNWDPIQQTAISDLEVVAHDEMGSLWHLRYPLIDSKEYIIVATTRPETMLGDVAVAVHPEDERYQHLIGQMINLPVTHRLIPIIADEAVDKDFGSGCVKITPAHDFNDYAMGERHQLPLINIFTPTASLNDQVPSQYRGLDRFKAREQIIADLSEQGLIAKIEPHLRSLPKAERSGAIIEPFLTNQWFMKVKPLTESAIKVVQQGQIKFVPESWSKIYFQWLENIQDWCISRQLWWGHRIPAWYDEQGAIYVGRSEQDVRSHYQLKPDALLQQDDDVLDTWFSAALWPFATLGWPEETTDLQKYYPTNVLVTGFDIIFFWVARMIMLGLKFKQAIPFETVYITGLIRDSEGQKMSKSKGNILDPIDLVDGIALDQLIHKRTQNLIGPNDKERVAKLTATEFPNGIAAYGTDSLRFTYYALASTGRDIRFDLGRIEGYRNFCNKLWNAARYILMNTESLLLSDSTSNLSIADRWIRSRLQATIKKVYQYFEDYRFDLLANTVYEFIWNEYCDWYLELSKPLLYGTDVAANAQNATRYQLLVTLETILRLIHPLMPFITEEIWQRVSPKLEITGTTIMLQPYPQEQSEFIDIDAENDINWLKSIVIAIRNIRGEMNIAPSKQVNLLFSKGKESDKLKVDHLSAYIKSLAKINQIEWTNEPPPAAATTVIDDLELFIPMADLIDKQAEKSRLTKEIGKLQIDIDKSEAKLNNPNYLQKAPQTVVELEKRRAAELQTMINILQNRLKVVEGLD